MIQSVRSPLAPSVYACCLLGFLLGSPGFAQESALLNRQQNKQQNTQLNTQPSPYVRTVESNQNLVTLRLTNASLRTILQEIGRQGKLRITYPDALVDRYTNLNVQIANVAAESALTHVLSSTELTYVQTAPKQIAIVRKEKRDSTAQEVGSINGQVLDSATQKGVYGALVTIVDANRSVKTQADGTFHFEKLPVGRYTAVVKILGYQSKQVSLDVQPGKTGKTTIVIQQSSTTLTKVVTTATGAQRSYEVGNDITRINVDEVRKYNDITSVADLLANRVPGMFMQSGGGDAGAGNRIRIRGIHSVTLNNDPILIIDGVRIPTIGQEETGATAIGATTTLSSRLDDIDPASIATIEVFKGPSAATLYGPDAANGVIVITRKRGLAGETRWTISANSRLTAIPRKFPGRTIAWAKGLETNDPYPCETNLINLGGCNVVDSVTVYSPLNDPFYTTMGRGRSSDVGILMQTGTATSQTALSVRLFDELGATQLPKAGLERLRALKGTIPSWARRPNGKQQINSDVNLTLQSVPLFDVAVRASLTHLSLRNNGNGMSVASAEDTARWKPETQLLKRNEESTDQYSAALTLQTRQWSWFSWRGTFGVNHGKTARDLWLRAEDCLLADCSNALGARTKADLNTANYTGRSSATATTSLADWATLSSSVGLDYARSKSASFSIEGRNMPFGISDPSVAPIRTPLSSDALDATAGAFLEERLAIAQRLFINGAIRRDDGSGLGSAGKKPIYPKLDLSWIAINRSIAIPGVGVLNDLRLRTAHGQSGHIPSANDLNATLTRRSAWYDGASHTVLLYNSLGNSLIQPERTSDMEFGVDMTLSGRIEAVSVTYFRHLTTDAIVPYDVAFESGLPTVHRNENLGKLRNTGFEADALFRLVDNNLVSWTLNTSLSRTSNKVLSLGRFPQMPVKTDGGVSRRVEVGYPLFGAWTRPIYGYDDRNHDGGLQTNEIVRGDSLVYVGWSQPKYAVTYYSSVSLWRGNLRFGSSFSQKVGETKSARMGITGSAIGDLEGQALDRAYLSSPMQTVSSLTWNSGDMTVQLPPRWLRFVRARSGTMSVSVSNIYQWTNWRGNDANVGAIGSEISGSDVDSGTTPNTRNWAFRFNLTY